ncbi:MAG: hypothetical protein ACFFER_09110 [Candidatus Thorarchaeota archaeon]
MHQPKLDITFYCTEVLDYPKHTILEKIIIENVMTSLARKQQISKREVREKEETRYTIYRADLPAHVVVGCSFLNG